MSWDVIVIGGGIAGASAACFLSERHRVLLLERESQPGYHTTGRSAAVYTENYGTDRLSALVRASRDFLKAPPQGFVDHPLLAPLGEMIVAGPEQAELLDQAWDTARRRVPGMERHGADFALSKVPFLRPDLIAGCLWEADACDIDVNGLLNSYLRLLRANGGALRTDAAVTVIDRRGDHWHVATETGERFEAPILINAAGSWVDHIGTLAGAAPIGLEPRRRTALLIDMPADALNGLPMVIGVGSDLYFRPQSGKLLISPSDQTPVEPGDVRPEELDIAIAADRFTTLTGIEIRRIEHSWAGLRSFVRDEEPVAGWDEDVPGFFWLAGQGGAGIKTSPALGMLTAALVAGLPLPAPLQREGINAAWLSPARLRA